MDDKLLKQAQDEIERGEWSCVVIKDEKIAHRGVGKGVKPLIGLYEDEAGKTLLRGATVADKIIGKGAAVILVLGGAAAAWGAVMSDAAIGLLEAHDIPYSYGKRVPLITNRTGDGICPIENSVRSIDAPEEGYQAIKATIAQLMKG